MQDAPAQKATPWRSVLTASHVRGACFEGTGDRGEKEGGGGSASWWSAATGTELQGLAVG